MMQRMKKINALSIIEQLGIDEESTKEHFRSRSRWPGQYIEQVSSIGAICSEENEKVAHFYQLEIVLWMAILLLGIES